MAYTGPCHANGFALIRGYLRLARPKHWVKNLFVFMPVPFAVASGAALDPRAFALGLLGFCLTNSSVYAFNDARDAERDRMHPKKRERPVAAGVVSVPGAYLLSLSLLVAGLALALASGTWGAPVLVGVYVTVNLFYSLGAKHVALLDVFLLSSGFVLRVLLGCALLQVRASNWLLLCSYALALFLALAKRRGDLVKGVGGEHRPALAGYNTSFLDHAMGITAGMSIIAYALYCLEGVVLIQGREFASLPFVVFGVLEYLRVAHVRGEGAAPTDLLLSSPTILISGLGWAAAILWSVRGP